MLTARGLLQIEEPAQRLRTIARLKWITGLNGYSVLSFALLGLLAARFSWSGLAVGVAVALSATLEVLGQRKLSRQDVSGLDLAAISQVAVFLSLSVYSAYQLCTLEGAGLLAELSPRTREFLMWLYGVDEMLLEELLEMALLILYPSLVLASFLYQGGLYFFYRKRRKELTASEARSGS